MVDNKKVTRPADVTPAWVRNQMKVHRVKVRDIVKETECNQPGISCWISGRRNMSASVKAMFWFYFEMYNNNLLEKK